MSTKKQSSAKGSVEGQEDSSATTGMTLDVTTGNSGENEYSSKSPRETQAPYDEVIADESDDYETDSESGDEEEDTAAMMPVEESGSSQPRRDASAAGKQSDGSPDTLEDDQQEDEPVSQVPGSTRPVDADTDSNEDTASSEADSEEDVVRRDQEGPEADPRQEDEDEEDEDEDEEEEEDEDGEDDDEEEEP